MQTIKDYPLTLKAEHVAEILNVSKSAAYGYMRLSGFPTIKMPGTSGSVRVPRDALYAWMMEQCAGA